MAKSMRSKWKRKMRAVKRVKYGAKELAKLNKLVELDKVGQKDFAMNELVTVSEDLKHRNTTGTTEMQDNEASNGNVMEVDARHNRKTLKDEHGQYPAWMNQKAMQKRKVKAKNIKRIKKKKGLKQK